MNTRDVPARHFSVRGSRNGSPVTLFWSPGRLGGDPPTVDLILAEMEIANACTDDHVCEPELSKNLTGGDRNPLDDPDVAYTWIERICDAIRTVDGKPDSLAAKLQQRRKNPSKP